jgi:hypothetical protein
VPAKHLAFCLFTSSSVITRCGNVDEVDSRARMWVVDGQDDVC